MFNYISSTIYPLLYETLLQKAKNRAGKMVQYIKALATTSDGLSSAPRIYMGEREPIPKSVL